MIIYQFSYRSGRVPLGQPIDCRCIPNPFSYSQSDAARLQRVRKDKHFEPLVQQAVAALLRDGIVAIGCQFGRHRSGAVAQEVSKRTGAKIIHVG